MEKHRFTFARGVLKAEYDKDIFLAWERGELTTKEAAMLIGDNNGCECTVEEFPAVAASCGFRRAARYDALQDRWRVNEEVEQMLLKKEQESALAEVMAGMARA